MGEVKIKSGNLIQSVTSYPSTGIYIWSLCVEADLKPDTQYTFAFKLTEGYEVNWNSNLFTTASPIIVGKGDKIIIATKTTKSVVSKDNINQYNSNYGGWSITKNNKTEETTGVYTEVQLLEGSYTSENIPEYQPYFLNRPAHQVTNGQFVDIPTHHYTNGRWQGELTSQSPLKFWADGNMLDWRVEGKTSGNLCERYTPVGTAQQYSVSLYMFADIQPSTTYTIAFEIDEGSLQYFNENLFTYSQYYVTGTGNKQMLQLNTKANIQKTASTWSDTYGWIIAKNYTRNTTVPHWKKIQLLEGTYTTSTIPPYEPYGGVGDWDETEQKYRIPVTVNGVTTNLFTDHQLLDGDSIDYATNQTTIPLATGNNTLTVDTAVQPKSVFVKFEG